MAISAEFNLRLKVTEDVSLLLDKAADPKLVHEIAAVSGTLKGTSTVPATKVWSDRRSLTAGADTFDLTSLPRGNLPAEDFTGLKVQLVMVQALSTNTNRVVLVKGLTNGYALFGSATGELSLGAGEAALLKLSDTLADVSATVKTVDVSSVQATAAYDVVMVAG